MKNYTKAKSETIFLIFIMLLLILASSTEEEEEQGQALERGIVVQEIFEVRDRETNLILDEYHIDEYNSFIDKYQDDYRYNRIDIIVMYSHDDYNETIRNELNRNGLSYYYIFIEDCY